jgi:hypothetical protein
MSRLPIPTTCEELLEQMVSFETVNPQCNGPAGGEARLAAHLESLASYWDLRTERCAVDETGRFNLLIHTPIVPESRVAVAGEPSGHRQHRGHDGAAPDHDPD